MELFVRYDSKVAEEISMNDRRASFLCCCAALALMCVFSVQSTHAQTTTPPDDSQTIQALLNEVRLLRKTLQLTGLNAYRSQIITENLRAHNDQVVRLTRMLEDARDEIENIEGTIPRMIEQGKLIENLITQEADATKRAQLEFESKERKRDVDRYKTLAERKREREQQISAQLRAEQSKLTELEGRLDAQERETENEVDRQRTEDAPQAGTKRPENR